MDSFLGGGKETRTPDICLAKAALYQLSYTPSMALLKAWQQTGNALPAKQAFALLPAKQDEATH